MADEVVLFDGSTLVGWRMAGPGGFDLVDRTLRSRGGMGLLWYEARQFADFALDVHWQISQFSDNSGVFVRFPDPGGDPWVAVHEGYEIQIHDESEGVHQTGAVYSFAEPSTLASNPPGAWNHFHIECVGNDYSIALNGLVVTRFTGNRRSEGFVGLQNHDPASRVQFRRVVATIL